MKVSTPSCLTSSHRSSSWPCLRATITAVSPLLLLFVELAESMVGRNKSILATSGLLLQSGAHCYHGCSSHLFSPPVDPPGVKINEKNTHELCFFKKKHIKTVHLKKFVSFTSMPPKNADWTSSSLTSQQSWFSEVMFPLIPSECVSESSYLSPQTLYFWSYLYPEDTEQGHQIWNTIN